MASRSRRRGTPWKVTEGVQAVTSEGTVPSTRVDNGHREKYVLPTTRFGDGQDERNKEKYQKGPQDF